MIRHGRTVVDRHGIAEIHQVSIRTADQRIAAPGHPAAVNDHPGVGRSGHKRLWDEQQAHAVASGEDIPPLPETDHPLDLLDAHEFGAAVGVDPWDVVDRVRAGKLPGPDDEPCGVPHWYRQTADAVTRAPRGRPAGATAGLAKDLVWTALEQAGDEVPTIHALMRETGLSQPTVVRYRTEFYESRNPA